MSRKNSIVMFITGALLTIFIIGPILRYFGFTPIEDLLTSLFGPNNYLALLVVFPIIIIVIFLTFKGKKED